MSSSTADNVSGKMPFSFVIQFLDSDYYGANTSEVLARPKTTEIDRWLPFLFIHVGCLLVFFTGWSWAAISIAVGLYFFRMFAITAFYHRYFSHSSFKTNRFFQFIFALWGLTSMQRGPLWWAAHHRHHHRASDEVSDIHSPRQRGFLWSHIGWITTSSNMPTQYERIPDLARFPELVFLNRFDWIGSLLLATMLYVTGDVLSAQCPELGTNGFQLVVWGFFISTVFLLHGTFTINSLAHQWGHRRYETCDDSRNNFFLALITLGEGWHNNHHRFPGACRQGFQWWEIDITYYGLKMMETLGIIYDLRKVPESVLREPYCIKLKNDGA